MEQLSIKIKALLDSKSSDIDEQIKKLSEQIKERLELKLKIDASDLEVITKKAEDTQEKLRTITKVKDSQFINEKVENQAFEQIQARIQEIRQNVDKLANVGIFTDNEGKIMSANLTYYNEKLGQTVRETMGWKETQKKVNDEIVKLKTFDTTGFNYIDNIEKAEKSTKKLVDQLNLFKQQMLGGDGFKGDIDILGKKFAGQIDKRTLENLRKEIQGLTEDTPNLTNRINQLKINISSLKKEAMQSGTVMGRMLENAFKFARFYLIGGAIVRFVNAIKGGVEVIKELDTSLTELNKVADLTKAQLEGITKRAYEAGTIIGRTGKEVIDATTEFKRAGYEIEEAFNLSQQALILTNIGDGIDDVKEASSSLIAVLKGFKKEARETTHIVDALNEVSNNFAVDTNNLTEIMKRVSGTIAQTGTSYEQLLGLATGGYESLRNAEMVASGLNMISQRLRGMTEDGEKVEGLIPKIQKDLQQYTKGAVSIIDKQNGGLHSTYEILEQLSKVYPTLTDEVKAYINEAIAGNRWQIGGYVQKCA